MYKATYVAELMIGIQNFQQNAIQVKQKVDINSKSNFIQYIEELFQDTTSQAYFMKQVRFSLRVFSPNRLVDNNAPDYSSSDIQQMYYKAMLSNNDVVLRFYSTKKIHSLDLIPEGSAIYYRNPHILLQIQQMKDYYRQIIKSYLISPVDKLEPAPGQLDYVAALIGYMVPEFGADVLV